MSTYKYIYTYFCLYWQNVYLRSPTEIRIHNSTNFERAKLGFRLIVLFLLHFIHPLLGFCLRCWWDDESWRVNRCFNKCKQMSAFLAKDYGKISLSSEANPWTATTVSFPSTCTQMGHHWGWQMSCVWRD